MKEDSDLDCCQLFEINQLTEKLYFKRVVQFEVISLKDISLVLQEVFPQSFDDEGIALSLETPIDGIHFCLVMEKLMLEAYQKQAVQTGYKSEGLDTIK